MLEAYIEWGEAVLYYGNVAHFTHNTCCTRAGCAIDQKRPALMVSGREQVDLNVALDDYNPT